MTYYKIKTQRNFQRRYRDNWFLMRLLTVVIQELKVFLWHPNARPLATLYLVYIMMAVVVMCCPGSAQCSANYFQTQTSLQLWAPVTLIKQPIPDRQPRTNCRVALTLRVFSVDILESVLLHSSHLIQLTGFILSFQL